MEFEDLSHLYIGCKAKDTFNDVILDWNIKNAHMYSESMDQIKPILRKWADRTADEVWHIANLKLLVEKLPMQSTEMIMPRFDSELMVYLLYRHFDLFDLIASGQAIDATTLTPNPYQNV